MSTKVYAYGCARPSREIRDAISEQLWIAHRYRVALWHLAMAGRATYRELRRQHFPELLRVEAQLARMGELYSLVDRKESPKEHQAIKVEHQRLKARARELREAAKTHAGMMADLAAVQERTGVLQRALRNVYSRTYGLYSGTYLHVEAAARSANAGTEDPAKPRWNGSGTLAIQLQGGRSIVDLTSGRDPSIHVVPTNRGSRGRRAGARTIIRYRLRSDGGGRAVLIDLPVMLHRPLPSDAKVTWAKLAVTKIHDHRYHYEVQLTTETEHGFEAPSGAGVVAVCLRNDDVWIGDEYTEPKRFAAGINLGKGNDLLSIRDKHRNGAIGALVAWRDRQDETADWVREEISAIEERRSSRRLYHRRDRLRDVVDDKTMDALDKWAYGENHLYWWQSGMRHGALNERQDRYRKFARELARRYSTLVIDSRPLDGRDRLTESRRWLGLYELRSALIQAFGESAHKMRGDSCDELLERFRDAQTPWVARSPQEASDVNANGALKKAKRHGFARKHAERASTARELESKCAE